MSKTVSSIAVTGGNGYIAAHIIQQLLETTTAKITATVRSVNKAEFLKQLPGATTERLVIVEADLLKPESFDFTGVDVVMHVASPYILSVKDPQTQLVDPAVKGTMAVLNAAKKAGSVHTVVLTSSIAAIGDDIRPGYVRTEDDWNTLSSLKRNPYYFSKVCAEKAAWAFAEENKDAFKLVVINPGMVIGPSLTPAINESVEVFKNHLTAAKGIIGLCLPLVDVRDVARAHLLAYQKQNASGRYIVCGPRTIELEEACKIMSDNFPEFAATIPKSRIPDWLMRIVSYTLPLGVGTYIRANLGRDGNKYSIKKVQEELGLTVMEPEQSIIDTVNDLKKWKHV
ncbi:hypothetical protein HDV05_005419 [Chytridiales sp. JEL 0842]|nr:hypothetical protein HDV05_005419 [Chytridiales sp. JEL 0842]